jgi:hypothetical protein
VNGHSPGSTKVYAVCIKEPKDGATGPIGPTGPAGPTGATGPEGKEGKSAPIERGIALHEAGTGHKLKISAPSVTSSSTILLTIEEPVENPEGDLVVVYSRESGVGFTAGLTAGGSKSHVDWTVIN